LGKYAVVGKRLPLKDAPEKVTGKALFTGDIELPGMLYAKILRSPYPHARVLKVDTTEAERLPGVRAVLSKNNAPRKKVPIPQYVPSDKVLFDEKVRFVGDEVVVVAAVSEKVAEQALKLIKVEYEELPAVFDPEESMKLGAPLIHDDKQQNSAGTLELSEGDIEEGFRVADYIFEETFRTTAQRHASMETHCAIASFDATGKLTIWSPTQVPFQLQELLAGYLDLPMSKVKVIKPYFGGGFGSKIDIFVEHIAALLSIVTGKPVKLVLTREEEFTTTVSRHAIIIRLKVGVKKDGTLSAIHACAISNEGAYLYKPAPLSLAGRGMIRTYRCPNTKFEGCRVHTNLMSAGAMRGYGNPQGHFAIESMVDMIAEKLGIDPVEYRLKNRRQQGDIGIGGLPINVCGLSDCLAKGKELIGWEKRGKVENNGGIKKRGIGMACYTHGTGTLLPLPNYSAVSIRINADGTVQLSTGIADLGTGSNTTLAQIVAEELGISLDAVDVISGDTSTTPYDEGAYACMTLYTAGNAIRLAVAKIRQQILLRAAQKLEVAPESLEFKAQRIYVKNNPEKGIAYSGLTSEASKAKGGRITFMAEAGFENTAVPPSFGAQFAEVQVDTETGQVEVLKMVSVMDTGTAINPMVVEGQIEGALQQGIGFSLTENPLVDQLTGKLLNPDFQNYTVLTALDMPKTEVGLVETYEPTGPFGAKGMSEPPMSGTAPAIANAIYNAAGIRLTELPMTSENVFKVMNGLLRSS